MDQIWALNNMTCDVGFTQLQMFEYLRETLYRHALEFQESARSEQKKIKDTCYGNA